MSVDEAKIKVTRNLEVALTSLLDAEIVFQHASRVARGKPYNTPECAQAKLALSKREDAIYRMLHVLRTENAS